MALFKKGDSESSIHLIKRSNNNKYFPLMVRAIAFILALIVCGLFVNAVTGISIADAYYALWKGTFGDPTNITSVRIKCWDSAIYAAKLLCIAVALAPAFKMKFWNTGAEGQVLMGALATAWVMKYVGAITSGPVLYIAMITCGITFGALWAFIPAFFKAKFETNETLFTLMMNYVAMQIMDYFYNDWKGMNSALDKINSSTKVGYFPIIAGNRYTINIIVFVLLAFLMYIYLSKTKHGYEIAVVGESKNTANYAGINVFKVTIRTLIISGAICGLCGSLTVAGQTQSIVSSSSIVNSITEGYGFTAIIVAWLAKFNTISMIFISLLIVFLTHGSAQLTNTYRAFAKGAGNVLVGIFLFFILGSEFFINYKIVLPHHNKEAK